MDIINHYEIVTYNIGEKDKYTGEFIHGDGIIYYMNKQRHRDNDNPAVIYSNGTQEWYVNGKLHRDNDQPAIIANDGTYFWWSTGQLHRDNDQPAIIHPNGAQEWWVNGEFIRTIGLM